MAAELFLKSAKTGKQIGPIASGDAVGRVTVQRAVPSDDLAFFGFSQYVLLSKEDGGWAIRPYERTVMATYLNGTEVVAERPLKNGDVISVGSRTNTAMRRGDLQVVLAKMPAATPCPLPGSLKAPTRSVVGVGAPKMAISVEREFEFKVSDFI